MKCYETANSGDTFECVDNGHTMRFNSAHYQRVRQARALLGLSQPETRVIDHPLVGRRVRFADSNEVVVIETVDRHFYLGFYEHAVYRMEGTHSHGVAFIKNISSRCSVIVEAAEEFSRATLL